MVESPREAHKRGIVDGRRAARKSRQATAPPAWSNLPLEESAYNRGYARGIRDVNRVRGY